jgi:predicted peptidase
MIRTILVLALICISACSDVSTNIVLHAQGSAGTHTPITIDSQGNIYGYYEYLPQNFDTNKKFPIIFFWNGQNAISGNGNDEINNLLNQGLPKLITEGNHYPAIIISGMLPQWNKSEIHPFVEYILKRYEKHIDKQKIYMTGFSAGGGVTLRYISKHPQKFAAMVPIAPAAQPPESNQPSKDMSEVSSWFFHNSGDMTVEIWRSNVWHKALKDMGGEHKITRPDLDSHYAWEQTYTAPDMWEWLLSQKKNKRVNGFDDE